MARRAVRRRVVRGGLCDVDVPDGAQPAVVVERAGRDRDRLAAWRFPEEARAAGAAEPATRTGVALRAGDPAQPALLRDAQVTAPGCRRRARPTVPAPALAAVADEDVAQRPVDRVAHGAAQA